MSEARWALPVALSSTEEICRGAAPSAAGSRRTITGSAGACALLRCPAGSCVPARSGEFRHDAALSGSLLRIGSGGRVAGARRGGGAFAGAAERGRDSAERGRSWEGGQRLLILSRVMPHTLPKNAHSLGTSKEAKKPPHATGFPDVQKSKQ